MRLLCLLPTLLLLASLATCDPIAFTRERFDAMDQAIDVQRDFAKSKVDDYAWGESYVLRGYVEMYLGTGDRDYLRRLVRVSDSILATRDDRRPRPPGTPKPPAVWAVGAQYTVARLVLKDTAGHDCILLRSIRYAYNDQTVVEVIPGSDGTFTLRTSNEFWQQHGAAAATFTDLGLDPKSPRYFESLVNDPQYIPDPGFRRSEEGDTQPSFLLVATDLRRDRTAGTVLAPVAGAKLVPGMIPYYGYIGPVYSGMTRFASLVHKTPALQGEFGAAARRFVQAARESLAAWEFCWRNGPEADEGYYLLQPRGADMWCDGLVAPLNYLGSAGQVIMGIWDCTGDPRMLDRARRMANLYKRACTLTDKGGYSWPYWGPPADQGWKREDGWSLNTPDYQAASPPDDLSHAAWELEFAVMCYERGIVFTRRDMRRFAYTFTRQVWTGDPKTLALRVDGSGGSAEGNSMAGARWLDLCLVEPRLFDLNRTLWSNNDWASGASGHLSGSYARMFRWQEELGRR
jgi:hypothetical protein